VDTHATAPGMPDDVPDGLDLPAAIAALASVHREVLLLRYQDDLSYAEIASVVGCSIGTVKSRLHHARRHLHEAIAREKQS
jgi:RNA polymerase sigma-70 factor, ECF subfamily